MNISLFDKGFKIVSKFAIKHSVEIAMGAAVVGLGVTIFTVAKATLKVNTIVKEDIPKKEKVKKAIAPCLAPTAAVIFTIASIAGMYKFGRKKEAALMSLLLSTQQAFQVYRNKERKRIGEEEESKNYAEVLDETSKRTEIPDIPKTSDEKVFCDSVTGQFFTAKMEDIYKSMYLCNREFILRGEVEFNEWLEELQIETWDHLQGYGWDQCMGWEYFGYQFIDFNLVLHKDSKGKEYYLITYPYMPHTMESALYEHDIDYEDAIVLDPCVDTDLWKKSSVDEQRVTIDKALKCP